MAHEENPQIPNLSRMADDAITQGSVRIWDLHFISVVGYKVF